MSDKEQPPQTPPQNTTPQVTTTGESVGGGHTSGYVTQEQHAALADKQKSDRDLLMIIMGGVVIFVVISFFIELVNLHIDYAQDKSLAEQNNEIRSEERRVGKECRSRW